MGQGTSGGRVEDPSRSASVVDGSGTASVVVVVMGVVLVGIGPIVFVGDVVVDVAAIVVSTVSGVVLAVSASI